jgi:hypothetical protein
MDPFEKLFVTRVPSVACVLRTNPPSLIARSPNVASAEDTLPWPTIRCTEPVDSIFGARLAAALVDEVPGRGVSPLPVRVRVVGRPLREVAVFRAVPLTTWPEDDR